MCPNTLNPRNLDGENRTTKLLEQTRSLTRPSRDVMTKSLAALPQIAGPSCEPARIRRSDRPKRAERPAERVRLRKGRESKWSRALGRAMRESVIGQERALEALIPALVRLKSNLHDPQRPLLTALLLGPTGVGKTETARALAKGLFGKAAAITRVDCQEYCHGHELAKLVGSPPGYVGHRVEPLLSQRRLDAPHKELLEQEPGSTSDGLAGSFDPSDGYLSVLLLDEVEKAHPMLWNGLLQILEEGELTLGDNTKTSFHRTIILMTSNVGSRELDLLQSSPLGFGGAGAARVQADSETAARGAAREVFPAEFLNRLDLQLVYGSLAREDLDAILDLQLNELSRRLMLAGAPLLLRVTDSAREQILEDGFDPSYGARPLRRALERLLVDPLSGLLAAGDLAAGDVVEVETDGREGLAFFRCSVPSSSLVV